jgi:hypothetical protein
MPAIFSRPPILRISAGAADPLDGRLPCWQAGGPWEARPASAACCAAWRGCWSRWRPAATQRFLRESRAKVWANTRLLDTARRAGPAAYTTRLAELERLAATRVADLMAPGQVVLKLAVKGFGVRLPDA